MLNRPNKKAGPVIVSLWKLGRKEGRKRKTVRKQEITQKKKVKIKERKLVNHRAEEGEGRRGSEKRKRLKKVEEQATGSEAVNEKAKEVRRGAYRG